MGCEVIQCHEVGEDDASVGAYLRRDILSNTSILECVERGVPPGPKQVWVASQGEDVVGVMIAGSDAADIACDRPEGLRALLKLLDGSHQYLFMVRGELRTELVKHIRCTGDAVDDVVTLTVGAADIAPVDAEGVVRKLGASDRALVEAFPASGDHEPELWRFVEWAEAHPEAQVVYGIICEAGLVGFVQAGISVDNVWDVGMIRVHDGHRRMGWGKAVLAGASRAIVQEGKQLLYQAGVTNRASLAAARAAGYREVCRTHAYVGFVRSVVDGGAD
ncbi:MAG: hypothetical protein CMJ49_00800 [Planctomycetaceae bacterium]|nr:hypothetical protein [Planctomycetaceae bacterium]